MNNDHKFDTEIGNLLRRFDEAKMRRQRVEAVLDEIAYYVTPHRGNISSNTIPLFQKKTQVFDSTVMRAADVLASTIHGGMTNPASKWVSFQFKDQELSFDDAAMRWIGNAAEVMMDSFNNPQSYFIGQNHQFIFDMVSLGTACMYVEESLEYKGDICFKTIPLCELYFLEDKKERVDTVFRQFRFTARQAAQMWGEKRLGETLLKALEENPDTDFDFLHAVLPSEDVKRLGLKRSGYDYTGFYISLDDRLVLNSHGYPRLPYIVSRFQKLTSELWGYSPSWTVLCDVKSVNKIAENILVNSNFQTNPPFLISDDGVISKNRIKPGAHIPGGLTADSRRRIEILEMGGRLDVAASVQEKMQKNIQDAFYMNQLLFRDGPQMTATEVVQISEEQLRLLGPQIGRFTSEYLGPLVDTVFDIQLKAGLYGPMPKSMTKRGKNIKVDVTFLGPLAKLQKLKEMQALDRTLTAFGPLLQVKPDLLNNFELDVAIRDRSVFEGVPTRQIIPKEVVDAQRAEAQKQQEQMQQFQMMKEGGEAIGKIADHLGKATDNGLFGTPPTQGGKE